MSRFARALMLLLGLALAHSRILAAQESAPEAVLVQLDLGRIASRTVEAYRSGDAALVPLQAFFDVALPVIRPGIVVIVVWAFVNIWGSFLIPFILLRSSDQMPASVAIYSFYSEAGTPIITLLAAYSLIYSLPVIALYLFVSWRFGFRFFGGIKA